MEKAFAAFRAAPHMTVYNCCILAFGLSSKAGRKRRRAERRRKRMEEKLGRGQVWLGKYKI